MERGATADWQRSFSVSMIPFILQVDSSCSHQTLFTKTSFFIWHSSGWVFRNHLCRPNSHQLSSILSSTISPARLPTNHGRCHFTTSCSHSFPLSSSVSSISLSRRASSTDILSCICLGSPTPSLRKLLSGYGLAMHFIIASYAHVPPISRQTIFIRLYRLLSVSQSFYSGAIWNNRRVMTRATGSGVLCSISLCYWQSSERLL